MEEPKEIIYLKDFIHDLNFCYINKYQFLNPFTVTLFFAPFNCNVVSNRPRGLKK